MNLKSINPCISQDQESRSVGAVGPENGSDLGPVGSDLSLEEVAGQTNPNCQLQNQTECVQVKDVHTNTDSEKNRFPLPWYVSNCYCYWLFLVIVIVIVIDSEKKQVPSPSVCVRQPEQACVTIPPTPCDTQDVERSHSRYSIISTFNTEMKKQICSDLYWCILTNVESLQVWKPN